MTLRHCAWGLLPLAAFALYLHTMGPTLVPYRDAGEMATSVTRLGILHPPGYPSYTLIGNLASRLPFANPAYRLNLLSALSLAAAWGFLLFLLRRLWGTAPAVLAVLLGAVSFQFWLHALISEMYTLNLAFLSGLLVMLYLKKWEAAAFVFGAGLGVRMDLMLCGPAFAALFFAQVPAHERWATIRRCVMFFGLGASVFFYLWIRANQQPLLNWGDPSTLERLWASVTRRSYGRGLDLLSLSYHTGENFWPEFILYLRHLARDFSLVSFPLALIGLAHAWKTQRVWFWVPLLGWLFTGVLFIFLGNLPINPHAVAIMEAAYLTPDIFYVLMIGAGLGAFARWPKPRYAVYALTLILIAAQVWRFFPAVSKRHNWLVADFIHNALYSVPEPSLVVAHSDVPVFSLFYGHWIHPGLKWRVPVAQGLAGSAWYQVMMERQVPKLDLEAMRSSADWEVAAKANPGWSLFGTPDTEWPADLYSRMVPTGLLLQYLPRGKTSVMAANTWLDDMAVYRGRYRYDAYYEFFSPEIVEEYAKAWMEWGRLLSRSGQDKEALNAYLRSLSMKPDSPYPVFQIAFYYFSRNDLSRADYYYHWCIDNFRKMNRQAKEWKSFASVQEGLRRDEAQATAHWGVIQERRGDSARAVELYQRALWLDPASADARYNLAVIYWRQERWGDVVEQLQALAAAHPQDMRWRAYLPKALERLKK